MSSIAGVPVFFLGEGLTPLPSLESDQAIGAAHLILADEARRAGRRGRHPKEHIRGEHCCYQGVCSWRRGSDLVERTYAAVGILRHAGLSNKEACLTVATLLGRRLGTSKRGRPRKRPRQRDALHDAETVRSLYNNFRRRHPWKEKLPKCDPVLEFWFHYAVRAAENLEALTSPEKCPRTPYVEEVLRLHYELSLWRPSVIFKARHSTGPR